MDELTIGQTIVVEPKAPDGSRHKGYEDIVVQDSSLSPTATLYRRERWETLDGAAIVADLAPGTVGGYRPHLHRLIFRLDPRGQMTRERILALLDDMGVVISKRRVVRLLTTKLEIFRDEDEAVLEAGLVGDYAVGDCPARTGEAAAKEDVAGGNRRGGNRGLRFTASAAPECGIAPRVRSGCRQGQWSSNDASTEPNGARK